MYNIYHVMYTHQQPTSLSYRMYRPVSKFLTKNKKVKDIKNCHGKFSRSKEEACNFTSLSKAIKIMIELEEKFSYNKDLWQVVLVKNNEIEVVDSRCVDYYRNLKVIEDSKNKIKELESIILKRQEDNKDKIKYLSKYQ